MQQQLAHKPRQAGLVAGKPRALLRRPVRSAVSVKAQLKVCIAGAPAAGKGTQCAKIIDKYDLVHISVGDILREEVAKRSFVGNKAKEYMDKGALVPDEVVVEMVKQRLGMQDCKAKGWLLDGYPRSGTQAEAIEKEGIRPDIFLLIDVPDSVLVERVVGRRQDPVSGEIYHTKFRPAPKEIEGRLIVRSDDTEEKCKARLATHAQNVDAVVGYYKDVLAKVNGNRPMDVVFEDICKRLDAILAKDPLEAFCQTAPDADECRVYND